jgi:phosphoribosylaminoimidazole-succinocarboxamide synthase
VSWFLFLEKNGIKHHMVAYGSAIDNYLPDHLRNNPDLQSRALVIEWLDMVDDVEFIVRGALLGTGKKAYDATGEICGIKLQPGLQEGDEINPPIATPSTKAKEGHDEHVSAEEIRKKYPVQTALVVKLFSLAQEFCKEHGIFLGDSKFEVSKVNALGEVIVGDEVLTPDSSRFHELVVWRAGRKLTVRKAPPSFDKETVRAKGKEVGIDKLDPSNPDDVAKAHAWVVPEELIAQTTKVYRYIFWRLTGSTIEDYLQNVMRVKVEKTVKNIAVVCGSESDLPAVKAACLSARNAIDKAQSLLTRGAKITVHIMSCHRNPEYVRQFAMDLAGVYDAIVATGGKAFALAGVLDAWIYHFALPTPVIGVALGEEASKSLLAAQLSIEEIPGQPVVMDEVRGCVYVGSDGVLKAIDRIVCGELPPAKPRTKKLVQMDVLSC